MPITKSAKKALRGSKKKRVFNMRRKTAMKDEVKAFRKLVADGKKEDAAQKMPAVQKAIDKAVKRGVIKKNTAARKTSRLAKAFAK